MNDETKVTVIPKLRAVGYGTYAAMPASGSLGDLYYATDRKVFYRWSGAAWQSVTISSRSGATADMGAAGNYPAGSLYRDTTVNLTYQQIGGAWVSISSASGGIAIFGDGSDGDVTISANTDLARDMYYNNLTINATITLSNKGYRIFVKGTLTNNGIISNPPHAQTYSASASGSLKGGSAGSDGTASTAIIPSFGGRGGAGVSGVSGVATPPVANDGGFLHTPSIIDACLQDGTQIGGGSGGRGAAAGGAQTGGGGGGLIMIIANSINNSSGIIRANGGNRAHASTGGGGGGGIILVYNSATWGTEEVNGGTGGNANGANGTIRKLANN